MEGPVLDSPPPPTTQRPWQATIQKSAELKIAWAAFLGLGWPVALVVSDVIRPVTADPNAAPSLLSEVVTIAVFGALVTTAVLAVSRLRSAAVAGVVLGGIMVADSLACPLSGHHEFGLWFVADFALFTAMLLASIAALGQRARATTS
jgi:hypothetical protein